MGLKVGHEPFGDQAATVSVALGPPSSSKSGAGRVELCGREGIQIWKPL